MPKKTRLDLVVFEAGLAPSREKARALIMAGEVKVNDAVVDKPGTRISTDDDIIVKTRPRFVSRGGEKLAQALTEFHVDVQNRICADVGASTGGFTDCLLQNGAKRVYAIDVGYGQLIYQLRQDARVITLERTNARYVECLDEPINLVVIDVSFISLRLLLPTIQNWLTEPADVVALIKPQFEAGKHDVGKGGVVQDQSVHRRVLNNILQFAVENRFAIGGLIHSPIKGRAGNTEFLVWLQWQYTKDEGLAIPSWVESVFS